MYIYMYMYIYLYYIGVDKGPNKYDLRAEFDPQAVNFEKAWCSA